MLDQIFKREPRFSGASVKLGEFNIVVPALTLKHLKEFAPKFAEFGNSNLQAYEYMNMTLPIIRAAIERNYPGVTVEMLEDLIDIGNFKEVLAAVMGASGIKGEASPVTTPSISA